MTEKVLFAIVIFLLAGYESYKRIKKTNRKQFDISSLKPLAISIFVILYVLDQDFFSSKKRFDERTDETFRVTNQIPLIEPNMYMWHSGPYNIMFWSDSDSAIHFSKEIKYDLFSKSMEIDVFRTGSENLTIETTFPSLFRKFNQEYYLSHRDKDTPMREIVIPISKLSADSILKTKGINLFNNSN